MSAPAVGVAICLALTSLAAQRPLLVDSRKSPTPLDTFDGARLLVADIDGDGVVDIARSACSAAGTTVVGLWRGLGGGRFAVVPGSPELIAGLADLDRDGDLDLISWDTLHRNDGGWRFTAMAGPQLLHYPVRGDLDGDGDDDLIAGGRVFLSTAPFVFQEVFGRLPGGSYYAEILADLNGDGAPDLACRGDAGARLFVNDRRGTFTEVSATHLPPTQIGWMDATGVDVEGDGDLDIAYCLGFGSPGLLLNDGSGRFSDGAARLAVPGVEATCVAAGDFDGDGDADLAIGTSFDGGVLLENLGLSFARIDRARWSAPRHPLSRVVLADVDGDRDLDLLSSGRYGEWLSRCASFGGVETDVAYNDGLGAFQPGRPPALAVPVAEGHAALGDLDGDGNLDALVTEGQGSLLLGDGRGGFGAPAPLSLPVAGRPTLGDVDGDRDLDAVLAQAQAVHFLRNPRNGRLAAWRTEWLPIPPWTAAETAVLADLDGDGDLDCAVATRALLFGNGSAPTFVLWNDGSGRFTLDLDALPPIEADVFDLRAGDIDGDGDLDLISTWGTYLNLRPGKFDYHPGPVRSFSRSQLALADLDGDGRLDVILVQACPVFAPCFNPDPDIVYWNEGDGRFTEQGLWLYEPARSIAVFDADGDGDLDLLFGHVSWRHRAENALYVNLGGRAFQRMFPGQSFPTDWDDTLAMATGDLDHDGDTDVVLFNALSQAPGAVRSRVYANATRQLAALDSLAPARPYRLRIHGGERGAVLLLAAQGAHIPTPFGLLGLDPRTMVTFGTYGPPAPGEIIAVDLMVPANPSLIGNTLWWQALVGDSSPLGGRLTNTVREIGTAH